MVNKRLKIFLCLVLQVFGTAALIWNTFVNCKHVSGTFRKDIADRILASQGPGPGAINLDELTFDLNLTFTLYISYKKVRQLRSELV